MLQTIKIFGFILIILLGSCIKQRPQLPANKNIAVDSTLLSLQLANEKLISHEDSLLGEYVKKESVDYIKDENGYWYCIYSENKEKKTENWKVAQVVFITLSLNDDLYFKKTEVVQFGKTQLIAVLDELIKKMNPGDSAITIAPWYLAYGLKGKENVPPYTSVKIKLSLNHIQ